MHNSNYIMDVSDVLKNLGFSPDLLGYHYARYAICLLLENPDQMITCKLEDIYRKTAKNFNSTRSKVERAIRHCIEKMMISGNLDFTVKVFGQWTQRPSGRITNGQFIFGVADYISSYSNSNS